MRIEKVAMMEAAKRWARGIRQDVTALALAARDPRTPWLAKAAALLVVAYALSPIDLIPDFIPVLGHLDDLVLVPLGILLAIRLIPAPLMAEFRAAAVAEGRPARHWRGAVIVVAMWVAAAMVVGWWLMSRPD